MAGNKGPWDDNDESPWQGEANPEKIVKFRKPGNNGSDLGTSAIKLGIGVALVLWLVSGFYQVQTNEQGVVLRFGKYIDTTTPGLHYHLPYPIETVTKVSMTQERSINLGVAESGRTNNISRAFTESHMLTGDENIVNPDEKLLEPNEMEILKKAFSFDSISIESVFTPLNQMVYITNKDLTIEKINQIILNSSFSRFPVFDLEKNEFVGIFSINRYFKEYAKDRHLDIRSVVLEPVFAYLDDKVDDIFNELNKTRIHLALVKNHQEEVIGMVTMEDILNQLVGQNPNLLPIKKEAKQ